MRNKHPKQMCKRRSTCALVRFQFTLCCCSFQLLCDPFFFFFLNQWPTLHFFSSRSFSQKRAAVEKDYALVRQSPLLLVCHGAALMFVETSFLNSGRPSVPLLSLQSRKEKTKPSSATDRVMSSADVSSLFSLCRRIAASETDPYERPPRCLAGAVQVLQPGEEFPAALWRVGGRL